jgi:hypothetical protein
MWTVFKGAASLIEYGAVSAALASLPGCPPAPFAGLALAQGGALLSDDIDTRPDWSAKLLATPPNMATAACTVAVVQTVEENLGRRTSQILSLMYLVV